MPDDIDSRFSLANERTFLAWIRTSLTLLAAGVAVVQLFPGIGPKPLRLAAGLVLAVLSLLLAGTSHRRWRQVDHAVRTGVAPPRPWQPAVTAIGVSVSIVIVIVLMFAG